MTEPRCAWTPSARRSHQFLGDPSNAGQRVGIGYFGTQPLECACTSCNASDYEKPSVPLGALPAALPTLTASLSAQAPTGETPTGPALRGACTYANAEKKAQPDRAVVILLVTDGVPQAPLTSQKGTCNPTLADATAAAAACLGGATPIRTYVLGVGPSLANLNQIAAAGGTGHAYLVESGGTAGVLEALGDHPQGRHDSLLAGDPEARQRDDGRRPVDRERRLRRRELQIHDVRQREDRGGMRPAAWRLVLRRPESPEQHRLCDASCAAASSPGGELRVSVGCSTIIIGAVTR